MKKFERLNKIQRLNFQSSFFKKNLQTLQEKKCNDALAETPFNKLNGTESPLTKEF